MESMHTSDIKKTKISLVHGSGGRASEELIASVFAEAFCSDVVDAMEDAAVLPSLSGRIAVTTDSFVVTPLTFPGGDIGRLAVCGTVNVLLMRGAVPKYITSAWILETGASIEEVTAYARSMAKCAAEAGVQIVCGDTKVVEGDGGIYINTTGVGEVPEGVDICASGARGGDVIIVSGNMGDHHAAILGCRMSISSDIQSDAAPLVEMCDKLRPIGVHSMRDVTRGGLATVLHELALASGLEFLLDQESIPVAQNVRDFAGLLGLDPLYMGNEGKMVAIVDPEDAEAALEAIKSSRYGSDAAIIGTVRASAHPGLTLKTPIGGLRALGPLEGEGLPRIC